MRGWRAYYANGYRVDSAQATWAQVPDDGLIGVVVFKEAPYRHLIDGHDWIWMEDGKFHIVNTHDDWGKWSNPPEVTCNSCVKRGAGMPDDDFKALQAEMVGDKQWPS